jgi:hypothetical protein
MISVYTFGAPMLGNTTFATLYDGVIKAHWRCVVVGDPTVATPALAGYVHVGKTAMFTRRGQLSLDKLVLLRWWQSEISPYPMYKLTAYHCAIAVWAKSHTGQESSDIGLWDWPLDKTTRDLFSVTSVPTKGPLPMHPTGSNISSPSHSEDVENPTERGVSAVPADALEDVVAFTR